MYADIVQRHTGDPDSSVGSMEKGDGQPTINIAAPLRVGLLTFCCEASRYEFNSILCLHAE